MSILLQDDPEAVVGRRRQHHRHPLAAGVLALGIVLHPAIGDVLMSLSTIVVAINAQLLRGVRL